MGDDSERKSVDANKAELSQELESRKEASEDSDIAQSVLKIKDRRLGIYQRRDEAAELIIWRGLETYDDKDAGTNHCRYIGYAWAKMKVSLWA